MNTSAITSGQVRKFSNLCKQKGVTKKDLQKLLETGMLAKLLAGIADVNEPKVLEHLAGHLEILMKAAAFDSISDEWIFKEMLGLNPISLSTQDDFIVDYSKSFAQLLRENNFGRAENGITEERFPIKGDGVHSLKGFLVPLKVTRTVARSLKGLDARGLRPGNTAELLSLPSQLAAQIRKRNVHIHGELGISVIALGTMDPVGMPNGNRKSLRLDYDWHKGNEYAFLRSHGGQYLSGYSRSYLLAFSK